LCRMLFVFRSPIIVTSSPVFPASILLKPKATGKLDGAEA
jgi:hypothetical protein